MITEAQQELLNQIQAATTELEARNKLINILTISEDELRQEVKDYRQTLRSIQYQLPKLNLPAQDMASFYVMEKIGLLIRDALEGVKK